VKQYGAITKESNMYERINSGSKQLRVLLLTAATLLSGAAWAGDKAPDEALSGWLGKEATVASSRNVHMPTGGKLTFAYDGKNDVKAGNAEVLASCHRLRSRDVAMRPAETKGSVELNDVVAFLIEDKDGSKSMTILVDSPSRMTDGGPVIIKF
jgi:hypothetical protein